MAQSLFCHQCNNTSLDSLYEPRFSPEGERLCPHCGSDFVELSDVGQGAAGPAMPGPFGPPLSGFGMGPYGRPSPVPDPFTAMLAGMGGFGSGPGVQEHRMRIGNASITFRSSTGPGMRVGGGPIAAAPNDFGSVLDALLNAGTQGMPLHDLVSMTTNMWGNGVGGGEGGMDALLSRLMAQYEPHSVATARSVRESLPKLRVAPREAAAAGDQEHESSKAAQSGKQQAGEQQYASACAGETCAVCHDEWDDDAEVTELPCKHCFCHDCIGRWLDTHNTCPTCRLALATDDPDYEAQRTQRAQGSSASARGTSAAPVPGSGTNSVQGGGSNSSHPALRSSFDPTPDSPMAQDYFQDSHMTQQYLQRMEESQQRVAALRGSMQNIQSRLDGVVTGNQQLQQQMREMEDRRDALTRRYSELARAGQAAIQRVQELSQHVSQSSTAPALVRTISAGLAPAAGGVARVAGAVASVLESRATGSSAAAAAAGRSASFTAAGNAGAGAAARSASLTGGSGSPAGTAAPGPGVAGRSASFPGPGGGGMYDETWGGGSRG